MKRIFLVILGVFLLNALVMAEISGFNQRGLATQEMENDELSISHPSLPIHSQVIVTNTENDKEIEVTVVGRIPASNARIADLSYGVWSTLELTSETDIIISTVPVIRTVSIPEPASLPEPDPAPFVAAPPPPEPEPTPVQTLVAAPVEPAKTTDDQAPLNLTVIINLHDERPLPATNDGIDHELLALLAATLANQSQLAAQQPQATVQPQSQTAQTQQPQQTVQPQQPQTQSRSNATMVGEVQVVPRLPDPNSGRYYYLQVGSFSSASAASNLAREVRNAGFDVDVEIYGTLHRVVVERTAASAVLSSIQRLGALGIRQVWVRE